MLPSRAGLAQVSLLQAASGCGTPRIAAGTAQRSLSLPVTDRQAFAATGVRLGKDETRLAAVRKLGFRGSRLPATATCHHTQHSFRGTSLRRCCSE